MMMVLFNITYISEPGVYIGGPGLGGVRLGSSRLLFLVDRKRINRELHQVKSRRNT